MLQASLLSGQLPATQWMNTRCKLRSLLGPRRTCTRTNAAPWASPAAARRRASSSRRCSGCGTATQPRRGNWRTSCSACRWVLAGCWWGVYGRPGGADQPGCPAVWSTHACPLAALRKVAAALVTDRVKRAPACDRPAWAAGAARLGARAAGGAGGGEPQRRGTGGAVWQQQPKQQLGQLAGLRPRGCLMEGLA